MKIVFISDTHGKPPDPKKFPEANVFVHAGDWMNSGIDNREVKAFNDWLAQLPYPIERKLITCGNHDVFFQSGHRLSKMGRDSSVSRLLLNQGILLLEEEIVIDGVKFFLSPWTPNFYPERWAFNASCGEEIKKHWDKIPTDTDVLVTHGPPSLILDTPYRINSPHCGCEELSKVVYRVKPAIHAFGHIHGSRGCFDLDSSTTYLNVSYLNEQYNPHCGPGYFLVDLDPVTKQVNILER